VAWAIFTEPRPLRERVESAPGGRAIAPGRADQGPGLGFRGGVAGPESAPSAAEPTWPMRELAPDWEPSTDPGDSTHSRMNVPNLISLLRAVLVVPFLWALGRGALVAALGLVFVAGVSDALDGFIARLTHQQSQLGAYLDPIADKLLLVSAYVALAVPGLHPGLHVPPWVAVLVLTRDVLILTTAATLYYALGERDFPPSRVSKLTTVFQVSGVLLVLLAGLFPVLAHASQVLLYAVAVLTVVSGVDYLARRVQRLRRRPPAETTAR
jgi:cardiolipin synthase (CMP-forming)